MEGRIKTIGEVQREFRKENVEVIETKEYYKELLDGTARQKYQKGYFLFHDGYRETNLLVPKNYYINKYPYVCLHKES